MQEPPDPAIARSLEGLLRALELEPRDHDRFRAVHEPARFPRVFGGQLAAQAMQAAAATLDGRETVRPHSIHATFVRSASHEQPIDFTVDRVRDGRTTATRYVTASQRDRPVLVATVSFHDNPAGSALDLPAPDVPEPDQMRTIQDWARAAPPALRPRAVAMWVDTPPPLDIRVGEAFTFLGGAQAPGARVHWLRLPREIDDDPVLHSVLLTYASDYFLLDMAVRTHPHRMRNGALTASTLDHAVWIHRPVRFDRWHFYRQDTIAIFGMRGLVHGAIHDQDGALVATVMQEVLIPVDDALG